MNAVKQVKHLAHEVAPDMQAAVSVIQSLLDTSTSKKCAPLPSQVCSECGGCGTPLQCTQHTPVSLSVLSKANVSWQQPSMKPEGMPFNISVAPHVSQTFSPSFNSTAPQVKKSISSSSEQCISRPTLGSCDRYNMEVLKQELNNPPIVQLWLELGGLERSLEYPVKVSLLLV